MTNIGLFTKQVYEVNEALAGPGLFEEAHAQDKTNFHSD